MGSISRENAVYDFIKHFSERFNKHFEKLINLQVEKLEEIQVNYYVQGTIQLSNNCEYPVHYRWSGEEEESEGKELDNDFMKIADYYNDHILGKTITSVSLGSDNRDDEVYLILIVDNQNETYCAIPMGFDPEQMVIDGYASELINESEFQTFIEKHYKR